MLSDYKILAIIGYTPIRRRTSVLCDTINRCRALQFAGNASEFGLRSCNRVTPSSLGAAFGVAISAAIFTALRASAEQRTLGWKASLPSPRTPGQYSGIRQAAIIALMFNAFMAAVAIMYDHASPITKSGGERLNLRALNPAGVSRSKT